MITVNPYESLSSVFEALSEKQTFKLPERYSGQLNEYKWDQARANGNALAHAWASAFEIAAELGKLDIFENQLAECSYFCAWPLALVQRGDFSRFLRKSYEYEWTSYLKTFMRLSRLHASKEVILKFSSESSLFNAEDKLEEESTRQVEFGSKLAQALIYDVFVSGRVDGNDLSLHARACGFMIKEFLPNLLPDDARHFKGVATGTLENLEDLDAQRTALVRTMLLPVDDLTKSEA